MSGWATVPLSEVLTRSEDWVTIHPEQQYKEVTVRLWGKGAVLRRQVLGAEIAASSRLQVHPDQFIISRIDARNGASGLVTPDLDGAVVSSDFPVFEVNSAKLLPRFLGWFSKTQQFIGLCRAASEGTTNRVRLKEDRFLGTPICLPPLVEQHKLIAQIDTVAGKIEEATRLRDEADKGVDAFVHSSIDQLYESQRAKYGVAVLGDVCRSITDGAHLTPTFVEDGVRFIFVGNVSSAFLHFDSCKYVSVDYYSGVAATRRPHRGDVLYSAVGATLGIPALVDTDDEFCFQRHVAIIKPNPSKLNSRYLWHMLRSGILFRRAWSSITGTAQPTVPLKAIRKYQIPAAPLGEQVLVVSYLDNLQKKLQEAKRQQVMRSTELNAVLPSILNRAFRVQL